MAKELRCHERIEKVANEEYRIELCMVLRMAGPLIDIFLNKPFFWFNFLRERVETPHSKIGRKNPVNLQNSFVMNVLSLDLK